MIRYRAAIAATSMALGSLSALPGSLCAGARGHAAAAWSPALLSGRPDEGRSAEDRAEAMHRPVPQDRLFHRPPRRAAAVPRAHKRVLRGCRAHGRRRDRMRCHLHQGSPACLPPCAVRPAHDHQHSRQAGAGGEMLASFQPRRSGDRQEGLGEMLHQRHHAGRIPHPARQDGRRQRQRDQRRRLPARHAHRGAPTFMPRTARC